MTNADYKIGDTIELTPSEAQEFLYNNPAFALIFEGYKFNYMPRYGISGVFAKPVAIKNIAACPVDINRMNTLKIDWEIAEWDR